MVKTKKKQSEKTERLVLLALLTALVAVLAYYGGFIKIGGLASISLTLIPVVVGATLCGAYAGAWLGGVSGLIFLFTPDAAMWLSLNAPGTVITVMVKGILSGFCAGLVYKLLKNYNRYFSVLVSAIICPFVNTGLFLLGSLIFFMDIVNLGAAESGISAGMYLIVAFVGVNFVFELLTNIAVTPAIVRILDISQKMFKKSK